MLKEMKEWLDAGIQNFSLENEKGKECNIQIGADVNYFYIVKSCNTHFENSSMRDAYSTHDFNNACEWISKNAKDYEALICLGYDCNEEL